MFGPTAGQRVSPSPRAAGRRHNSEARPTNASPEFSNLWPMEFIADWTLQYRGDQEMRGWSEGLNAAECWTETEKTGRVRLLFLRKP